MYRFNSFTFFQVISGVGLPLARHSSVTELPARATTIPVAGCGSTWAGINTDSSETCTSQGFTMFYELSNKVGPVTCCMGSL